MADNIPTHRMDHPGFSHKVQLRLKDSFIIMIKAYDHACPNFHSRLLNLSNLSRPTFHHYVDSGTSWFRGAILRWVSRPQQRRLDVRFDKEIHELSIIIIARSIDASVKKVSGYPFFFCHSTTCCRTGLIPCLLPIKLSSTIKAISIPVFRRLSNSWITC